jgi:hypothetical protein
MKVDYQDFPACPCQAAWLPVYERNAQRLGYIPGALHLFQLIGGNPKSGGTHLDGGAGDWSYAPGLVGLARKMGADATWQRPFNWDGKNGIEHIHSVLRGCPHNAPARYQIDAVDAGFNGLGNGGRAAPDKGPRPLSGRTWREGIAWALQEEDDAMALTEAQTKEIFDKALAEAIPSIVAAVLAGEVRKATADQTSVSLRRAARATFEAVEN